MIVAFLAFAGRPDNARAALLAAHAVGEASDADVTLVRATLQGEPFLPEPDEPLPFDIVEKSCRTAAAAAAFAVEFLGRIADGHVVLDLPAGCLGAAALARRVDVRIVTVGHGPLDERTAALPADPRPATPAWFLGCNRSGGGSGAAALARGLEAAGAVAPRVLPLTMPRPGRPELADMFAGRVRGRDLRWAGGLLGALEAVACDPLARSVDPSAAVPEVHAAIRSDERRIDDRLRDLADALQAIRDGVAPTPADLECAPLLDDWAAVARTVPAFAGRVHGHPDIGEGEDCVTSDVYSSDGSTWARTLSRYYRLGTPRSERGPIH